MTECPYHPEAVRCTHVDDEYVVVHEHPVFGLIVKRGLVGEVGSVTASLRDDFNWETHWIEEMRTGTKCWGSHV